MKSLKIIEQITIRNEESLNKYLNDISKISLISLEREVELARQIKAGSRLALNELTKANLRFVVSVAKQYQNKGLLLPDLINEGNLGLFKAAKRFDETRGFKFISYAVWWIRQGIIQSLSENSRMIRLPLNKIGAINKIKKSKTFFEQKYGREPTSHEISEIIEVPVEEVDICIQSSAYGVSIDAPLSQDTNINMHNIIITDMYPQPDGSLLLDSLDTDIEAVLNSLSERDSDVIKLHYGIGSESSMTLLEIGQLFGITRERVRQIKDSAISRIKNSNKSHILIKYLG